MHGLRQRVGLIVPSSNTVMEEEFGRVLPRNLSLHVTRIRLREVTRGELLKMERDIKEAVYELADADVDVIVFGCTTGSLIGGYGYDLKLLKKIEGLSGKPAVTTSTAVVNALKTLNVGKLAVATPYIDELNRDEKRFLEGNGFIVKKIKGLNIKYNLEIGRQPPNVAYELAKSLYSADIECIFISCTNFRTLEVIKPLEEELNIPIVTSNQATFWYTYKKLNLEYRDENLGRLFSI